MIEAIKERVLVKGRKKGTERKEGWWNRDCRRKRKEVRMLLRKWRRGAESREEYWRGKKEYRRFCEKRKEEKREELMEEARKAKTQSQVWRVNKVNKERRRKTEIINRIKIEEWDEYFRRMLGGTENQVERRDEREE